VPQSGPHWLPFGKRMRALAHEAFDVTLVLAISSPSRRKFRVEKRGVSVRNRQGLSRWADNVSTGAQQRGCVKLRRDSLTARLPCASLNGRLVASSRTLKLMHLAWVPRSSIHMPTKELGLQFALGPGPIHLRVSTNTSYSRERVAFPPGFQILPYRNQRNHR